MTDKEVLEVLASDSPSRFRARITFSQRDSLAYPCGATAQFNGKFYYGTGRTYEDAEKEVVYQLKEAVKTANPPPPKDVDL